MYKLITFGIPIYISYGVFCDNKLLVKNTRTPESVLNNSYNDICYNRVIESQSEGAIRLWFIPCESYLSYFLTNTTMSGSVRNDMV